MLAPFFDAFTFTNHPTHMTSWMISLEILALILLGAFSCSSPLRGTTTNLTPPCERDNIGTICFFNETAKDVDVCIGDSEASVRSATTICLDIYAGNYEYKAKQGWRKWRDEVEVRSCSSSYISLFT